MPALAVYCPQTSSGFIKVEGEQVTIGDSLTSCYKTLDPDGDEMTMINLEMVDLFNMIVHNTGNTNAIEELVVENSFDGVTWYEVDIANFFDGLAANTALSKENINNSRSFMRVRAKAPSGLSTTVKIHIEGRVIVG